MRRKAVNLKIPQMMVVRMPDVIVKFKGPAAPQYQTAGAAGCDIKSSAALVIPPGESSVVPTGLFLEIPQGYEGQVRSRSGLAAKNGVFVLNSPGTIDSDYRGEIKVILANMGPDPFPIFIGDRIAQLVIAPVTQVTFEESDFTQTSRGAGGFGSTGVK